MGELQDEIVEFLQEIKILQSRVWGTKMRHIEISPYSVSKFIECEALLDKLFDNLADVRTLEAVEQRYDPS